MKQCKFERQGDRFVCPVCGANYSATITGPVASQCGLANTPPKTQPKPTTKPIQKGPGDYLHDAILRHTGEDYAAGCGCEDMVRQMNTWGPTGCRKHIDAIIAKMLNEAAKRPKWKRFASLPGARLLVKRMILSAIHKAEREDKP